jgi:hypothetical protein
LQELGKASRLPQKVANGDLGENLTWWVKPSVRISVEIIHIGWAEYIRPKVAAPAIGLDKLGDE